MREFISPCRGGIIVIAGRTIVKETVEILLQDIVVNTVANCCQCDNITLADFICVWEGTDGDRGWIYDIEM